MRILLVYNYFKNWCGDSVYFESLVKLLRENNHEVMVYTKDSKDINENNLWQKIKIALGMFWSREVEKELTQIIKEFKPDLAHLHNIYPLITPTVYWVCRKQKIPIIQHIHNYRFMCPKGLLFRNNKICEQCVGKKFPIHSVLFGCYHRSRLASAAFVLPDFFHKLLGTFDLIDLFVFTSEFTRNYYLKNFNITANKTVIAPHFTDIPNVKTAKTGKRDFFIYVGRFSEEKGIIQLLELFKTLPKIKLTVIGDGPLKHKVMEYRRFKNITIKNFLKKERYSYISKARYLIVPSLWYEIGPIVMLESLALGTPVIIPRSGGFPEAIKDGETGLFYRFNDFNNLKFQIFRALDYIKRETVYEKMRRLDRQKYADEYNKEAYFVKIKKIYEDLLVKLKR